MALQLHKIQAFSPRPPSSYLQVHYSSLPVPQKVFMLSVVFLLLDSFSQYLTNGDIRYWEKLSNAFTAVLPLSKFFASRQKNDEILTKSSHFGKALHTPDQQLHLHGILAPPCRKGAPLHESKERDLYNWRSTGNCDYINWRSHHAKLSGDLETG